MVEPGLKETKVVVVREALSWEFYKVTVLEKKLYEWNLLFETGLAIIEQY